MNQSLMSFISILKNYWYCYQDGGCVYIFHFFAILYQQQVSKDYVITTLNRWQGSSYEDVEAAVSLLYSLGEALPASHGNHFSGPCQVGDPDLHQGHVSQVSVHQLSVFWVFHNAQLLFVFPVLVLWFSSLSLFLSFDMAGSCVGGN